MRRQAVSATQRCPGLPPTAKRFYTCFNASRNSVFCYKMPLNIYDYLDHRERNLVSEWITALPFDKLRSRLKAKLQSIALAEPGLLPGMMTPTPRERSIMEIVLGGRSGAFRLFVCRGPDNPRTEITLLCGGQEKDSIYVGTTPSDAEGCRQNLINKICRRRKHEHFKGFLDRSTG